ncbi:SGNH hydrolase [Lepidopterella palustris CBS 459.81]|uniref:SGNH hydrolase n=1 Tax=Lepidopterella palustris CBS 459.81 TaxID=1314670 RepID=A0A8E2E0E3_9PEZI|nr:SGNH hydrolase [Lepidopterella palustris CBS 459.81]
MFRLLWTSLLGLAAQLPGVLAYPLNPPATAVQLDARADKFIFGAIGDSWASGVSWAPWNQFDDNKSGCMRYKFAWSTVVNASYADWLPDGEEPQFEFEACSGARLDGMMGQMDQLTRPKVVLMEAGGNNADFYPMADSCLFHGDPGKKYGKNYEDDDPNDPKGECRVEIRNVRGRVEGDDLKNKVIDTIHAWRGHKAVMGNEASLFLLGYPWFFAYGEKCNDWTFSVFYSGQKQMVVMDMRKEFNELVDHVNRAIREAAESFKDPKIQYIDINPAFNDHRFCEEGHSKLAQFNWNNDVHIWNSPGRWFITIKNGDDIKTYDMAAEPAQLPPAEDVENLIDHPDDKPRQEGDDFILTFRDPENPEHTMEWKANPQDYGTLNGGASIARTLHPTEDGHRDMGGIIVERLKRDFKEATAPDPYPPVDCPSGCDCIAGVPRCT